MLRRHRPMALFCLVLAVSGLPGCASAPRAASRALPPPSRVVLENGVRLITQEHRTSDIVALQLWVGVGGRDEAAAERGFAHFAEHMLFKGTETLGRGFVDREVEAVGGRTNAGTSYDYTYYYMLLPAARAARGVEVLADMAFNARFDADDFDKERLVVFEEMRRGEDNPRTALYRRLYDLVFQGHEYGHPVLGDRTALEAATAATLRAFYKAHYAPQNLALVVAGPIDREEIRAAAARHFGRVPASGPARGRPDSLASLREERRQTIARPERQAALGLGWTAPPIGHADMAAVDLLVHILGGSRSSRLNQALRERARLVSSIEARYTALEGTGILSVTAQLEPADEARVEAAILTELTRIQDDGVTPAELARAITAAESERVFSRETVEGLALAYGRAELSWSIEEDLEYPTRLRAVTADQVKAAARRYLAAPRGRLALVPKTASP